MEEEIQTQEEVEVNISGGSIILSINPEDIKVKSKGLETEDTNENTVEIKIEAEQLRIERALEAATGKLRPKAKRKTTKRKTKKKR